MSLIANAQGQVAGQFVIPANIPVGSKKVEFRGTTSQAATTFVGRGVITERELQQVTTTFVSGLDDWQGDPLAQTFNLTTDQMVCGVRLKFSAKSTSRVLVQIRQCQNGYPTSIAIAEALLAPTAISLTDWTEFRWPPTYLKAGEDYALVIACDDAVTALKVATLGHFDSANQTWVTSQPYEIGVLFSSSNNKAWTAHQDQDLAFQLLSAQFSATRLEIPLTPIVVTAADYLMVFAVADQVAPPTTQCYFEITTPAPNSVTYSVMPGQSILLPAPVTGTVTGKAILIGTSTLSPRLHPDVQIIWSAGQASGTYITRAITAGAGSTITVIYNALIPGGAAVLAEAEDGASWTAIPQTDALPIGDNWIEVTRVLTGYSHDEARVRLTLTGTAQARPIVRNLQVIVT